MSKFTRRIREPVKREGAEQYVLISLLAFAATVILTRLFLDLTGYPQLGSSTLHIAHVLWGGLLLFAAALLPLLFANRWVYTAGGLLSGIGVGLFIDEVGKFITQTNDYFYPPAASIIYAVFLLTVLLYLRLRRPTARNTRAELYHVLDALQEVLDHDLDPQERAALEQSLRRIEEGAGHADLKRLAYALHDFVRSDTLHLAPIVPRRWQRYREWSRAVAGQWLNRRRFKVLLTVGLGAAGVPGFVAVLALLFGTLVPVELSEDVRAMLVTLGQGARISDASWITVRLALESIAGLPLMFAASLLAMGQDRRGLALGRTWLVLSLTIVNVFVFYFDQFRAVIDTLFQFALLMAVLHYQRRYLAQPHHQEPV